MVGSTGHPFSSMIGKVDLESLAIATQFLRMKMSDVCTTTIFIFQNYSPCKNSVRSLLRDFNAERQPVANSHCFNLGNEFSSLQIIMMMMMMMVVMMMMMMILAVSPPWLCCQGS